MRAIKLIAYLPIALTLYRTRDKPLYIIKHISSGIIVFYPALYFLLKPSNVLSYTFQFAFLTILCWAFYEMDYLINDFIAVKYEDLPYYRDYTKRINFTIALIIRIGFLILSAFILQFNIYFLLWMLFLGVYIVLLNLCKTKKSRISIYPCMRLLRHLFIPLVMTNFNPLLLYPCLVLHLPEMIANMRSTIVGIAARYFGMDREAIGLDTTYYEVLLKCLPLQIFLLFAYHPAILTGELLLMLISFIAKKRQI